MNDLTIYVRLKLYFVLLAREAVGKAFLAVGPPTKALKGPPPPPPWSHETFFRFKTYNELSQKPWFQSVPIAALCLYNICTA